MQAVIITLKLNKMLIIFLCISTVILFFTNAKNTSTFVFEAIEFCIKNIIPTLMPFMIITSTFLYSKVFLCINPKQLNNLGVCKKYFPTSLIASLCGFVVGPKTICEDASSSKMKSEDFSSAISMSSNAGIGFVIGCVGARLWGSVLFGALLFIFQILSSICINKVIFNIKSDENSKNSYSTENTSFLSAFSKGISSSISSLMLICTYTIFFSVFLNSVFLFFNIDSNSILYKIAFVVFEFCQGSFTVMQFDNVPLRALLSGFCVGFGGICVHLQTFAVCEGFNLNKKKFFLFKLLQGILCGIFSFIIISLMKI